MIFAGILAGGTGSRMGADRPKQFLEINGTPILEMTVARFLQCNLFDGMFVAAAADWVDYTKELIKQRFRNCDITVVQGGSDRTGSMLKVIEAVRERAAKEGFDADASLLVTHDAARPFVTSKVISDNIVMALRDGCAGTAVPATDTIMLSADGVQIVEIPDRRLMFHAQTPQSFNIGRFTAALDSLTPEQRAEVTDMCGVFTRAGIPVGFSRGDVRNIKITTPADMLFAEAIEASFE